MIRPLYKAQEPFMETPTAHGYLGVIMYDDKDDKVQCHICGGWYRHVGSHAARKHSVPASDYKDRFGLAQGIALCGTSVSRSRSEIAHRSVDAGTFGEMVKTGRTSPAMKKYLRRRGKYRAGTSVLSVKNKHGLCALQMLSRYQVVKAILRREPLSPDIKRYDPKLMGAIYKKFKSLNKYKRMIGAEENAKGRHEVHGDIELVAHLRRWVDEHGGRPQQRDFLLAKNGYPGASVFARRFGSWSNALRTAGIK